MSRTAAPGTTLAALSPLNPAEMRGTGAEDGDARMGFVDIDMRLDQNATRLTAREVLAQLGALANLRLEDLTECHGPKLREEVQDAVRALAIAMPGRPYHDIPHAILAASRANPHFTAMLHAALIARLPARAVSMAIPEPVLPELTRQAVRILHGAPTTLDDDAARKDVSICLALSLPCVAQLVEETGTILRGAARHRGPGQHQLIRQLLHTGFRRGPYLEIHTHTPMLHGFTEAGWTRCYTLIADILRARPQLLGMVGGSWFYDPALATISPRLAYLAELPMAHGAFRVRAGRSAEDAALATATSPTRRALMAAGKYTPERWQLIWPRAALLDWAARQAAPGAQ